MMIVRGMNTQAKTMPVPTDKEEKRAMRIIDNMTEALHISDEPDLEERKELRKFIMYGMVTQGGFRPEHAEYFMNMWQIRNGVDHLPLVKRGGE